jgi:deoxyribonuclease IV
VPPRRPSPVGTHLKVGAGLARGVLVEAREVGASAVQMFLGNPRGWTPSDGDPREDAAFRDGCAESGIVAFVHAPYLVNFGSATSATLTRSVASTRHALLRGAAIGAAGVVVHTGTASSGSTRDASLRQVRENLLPLLDELDAYDGIGGVRAPRLLLEPTAGGGQALAAKMEHLGPYLAALDEHPRVGVCLDTCHAHAAGHDLARPGGVRAVLTALVKSVGKGRLGLVHANDSRDACGSTRDRHARIGQGRIGAEPFAELFRHPATRGVPVVIETPGDTADRKADIAALVAMRDSG